MKKKSRHFFKAKKKQADYNLTVDSETDLKVQESVVSCNSFSLVKKPNYAELDAHKQRLQSSFIQMNGNEKNQPIITHTDEPQLA